MFKIKSLTNKFETAALNKSYSTGHMKSYQVAWGAIKQYVGRTAPLGGDALLRSTLNQFWVIIIWIEYYKNSAIGYVLLGEH